MTFALKIETRVPQDKRTSSLQKHIRRVATSVRQSSIYSKYLISLSKKVTSKHRQRQHSSLVFYTTRKAKGRILKSLQNF